MNARRWWLGPACVALWLAACGGDDQPPPLAAGGTSSAGGVHRAGSSALAGVAGAPGEGGGSGDGSAQGGQGLDLPPIGQIGGGSFAESMGGAPPNPPPRCDPDTAWADPIGLAQLNTEKDERLLAMTFDERTLVFSRDGALLLADRADADADFTGSTPLVLPAGYTAARGLALDASGSSLVVTRDDGSSFAELERPSRSAGFGSEPRVERFAAVNDARTFSGGELSSPVLSEDGETFFYVERSAGRSDVWRASGPRLDERTKLDPVTLGGGDGSAKLTLSVTSDLRALFVLDEALGHVVGLWSPTPRTGFTRAVPLPDLESAFTNGDCSRLYGTRDSGASLDLVLEVP